jgi:hypothetical protein|tara:strand:- start:167 stop:697 length:531 start_codon:yes stop_codon:yes gene_type:complete
MNATTRSYIKVHNISPEQAEDFEFDYEPKIRQSEVLQQLVPSSDDWGGVDWIGLGEYEYNASHETMHFVLDTKWAPPTEWLRNMSMGTHYFQNKLVTMATIQKDETLVTGVSAMDGEVMQNKIIFEKDAEEVGRHYDNEQPGYALESLDNQIWDSIGKFVKVCEQFYLEGGYKNDY